MEFIKDNNGIIIISIDEVNLYYFSQMPEKYPELTEEELKKLFMSGKTESISIKCLENDSGNKLITILESQKELGIIRTAGYILKELEKSSAVWSRIIARYEKSLFSLNERIVLIDAESESADGWIDTLYLGPNGTNFELSSCHYDYMTAVEKLDKFPVEDDDYWRGALANSEFIEATISDIDSASGLYDGIVRILEKKDIWNIQEEDIKWDTITDSMLKSKTAYQLGLELKLLMSGKNSRQ